MTGHPSIPLAHGLVLVVMAATGAAAAGAPALDMVPLAPGENLTGDWFGLRSGLASHGLTLAAGLAVEGAVLSRDGADGQRRYEQRRLDISARVDTATVLGVPGGTLFADAQDIAGDDGASLAGTLQRYGQLDAPHRDQLARLWYEQRLWDDAVAIKIGKEDVNAEFAASTVAAPFLNRAFAYSPSLFTLPTYPDPATGLSVGVDYGVGYLKAGVYDGRTATGATTGDRWLHLPGSARFEIAEAGVHWGTANARGGGVAIGTWRHTAVFPRFDGGTSEGTGGSYALADVMLWPAPGGAGGGISAFVSGGLADRQVTPFARHLACGLASSDPGTGTGASTIGVAGTWVGTSREPGSGCDADELVIEAFLRYRAAGWLLVTPDLQWFRHPGGILAAHDEWVGMVRADVAF